MSTRGNAHNRIVFERFTDDARQVVVRAQAEARRLGHNWIGTEHVLLGLLDEQAGIAAEVLESLGLGYDETVEGIVRFVDRGDEVTQRQIPFTPRTKRVLELSLREALSLGDNYIGPEHILLGLVREREGIAARVLRELDIGDETVRSGVLERVPRRPRPGAGRVSFGQVGPPLPRRWEYRVEDGLDPRRLDELGADGWELVAAVPDGNDVQLVFKRPREPATFQEQRSA